MEYRSAEYRRFPLFLGACIFAGGLAAAGPSNACRDFRAKLPKDLTQGFVIVPEDWTKPAQGPRLHIFYYGKLAADSEVPVVFFNGGPGQDSHESYLAFQARGTLAKTPMLFVDQRGNGCSSPYPTGNDAPALTRLLRYGSRAIVLDAEALRKKLFGAKPWRIFGQSYGGYIVHRYLEMAPTSLTAALSHGAAIFQDDGDFTRLRLLAQRHSAELYFARYPTDRATLARAKAQLGASHCFKDRRMQICGAPILDALVYSLAFETQWAGVHDLIDALADHSKTAVPQFVKDMIFAARSSSLLPSSVIDVLEAPPESPDGNGKSSCAVATARLRAAGEKPETWPINECRYVDAIKSLAPPSKDAMANTVFNPDPFRLDLVIASLKKYPALRFFLYASRNDPIVPEGAFADEAKALKGLAPLKYLKDSGHDGFFTEAQITQDLAATQKR